MGMPIDEGLIPSLDCFAMRETGPDEAPRGLAIRFPVDPTGKRITRVGRYLAEQDGVSHPTQSCLASSWN